MTEIDDIVNRYIDCRLNVLIDDVYSTVSVFDPMIKRENVRMQVNQRFRKAYDVLIKVNKFFERDECEVELANRIFEAIKHHQIEEYLSRMQISYQ